MYYEELDTGPNIKTVLDVISLCDKFLVKKLLDSCMDSVVSKITTDNCLEICERSFGMTRCERLLDTAFSCFMRYYNWSYLNWMDGHLILLCKLLGIFPNAFWRSVVLRWATKCGATSWNMKGLMVLTFLKVIFSYKFWSRVDCFRWIYLELAKHLLFFHLF